MTRYRKALESPGADSSVFASIFPDLERGAAAGHAECQDAVATILGYGLHHATAGVHNPIPFEDAERATQLWASAARQGLWCSFDNLVTRGVGPVADAARAICCDLQRERPDLVGASGKTPIFGPPFIESACQRFIAAAL